MVGEQLAQPVEVARRACSSASAVDVPRLVVSRRPRRPRASRARPGGAPGTAAPGSRRTPPAAPSSRSVSAVGPQSTTTTSHGPPSRAGAPRRARAGPRRRAARSARRRRARRRRRPASIVRRWPAQLAPGRGRAGRGCRCAQRTGPVSTSTGSPPRRHAERVAERVRGVGGDDERLAAGAARRAAVAAARVVLPTPPLPVNRTRARTAGYPALSRSLDAPLQLLERRVDDHLLGLAAEHADHRDRELTDERVGDLGAAASARLEHVAALLRLLHLPLTRVQLTDRPSAAHVVVERVGVLDRARRPS